MFILHFHIVINKQMQNINSNIKWKWTDVKQAIQIAYQADIFKKSLKRESIGLKIKEKLIQYAFKKLLNNTFWWKIRPTLGPSKYLWK